MSGRDHQLWQRVEELETELRMLKTKEQRDRIHLHESFDPASTVMGAFNTPDYIVAMPIHIPRTMDLRVLSTFAEGGGAPIDLSWALYRARIASGTRSGRTLMSTVSPEVRDLELVAPFQKHMRVAGILSSPLHFDLPREETIGPETFHWLALTIPNITTRVPFQSPITGLAGGYSILQHCGFLCAELMTSAGWPRALTLHDEAPSFGYSLRSTLGVRMFGDGLVLFVS